ncbi:MAG: LytR family transcriptional regulator, partial [Catenulispora sp.]|nr:LytR family transcriptional regulator [Catenulispora sp.]
NRTTILYGKGAAKAAALLAAKLGVGATPTPSTRTAADHVIVRIGADYSPRTDPGGPTPVAPSTPPTAAPPPGIAMDNGITCVN